MHMLQTMSFLLHNGEESHASRTKVTGKSGTIGMDTPEVSVVAVIRDRCDPQSRDLEWHVSLKGPTPHPSR